MAKRNGNGFPYEPSTPPAAVFLILFSIAFFLHVFQMYKAKTWFMLVLVTATGMEVVGYAFRLISIYEKVSKTPRIVSETMLVSAPAFFAAQDYMIVGRMIAYVGNNLAIIRDTWITKIFVCADLLTILTQVLGITVLTGAETLAAVQRAKNILLAGLSLQVVTFGVFLFVTAHFQWVARKTKGVEAMKPLQPLFVAIYVTGSLITGRSIFRTIEFASVSFSQGQQSGYLVTHEWPFYVLDSVPIIISTFVINYIHPGDYLPSKKGTKLDESPVPSTVGRSWFAMSSRKTLPSEAASTA